MICFYPTACLNVIDFFSNLWSGKFPVLIFWKFFDLWMFLIEFLFNLWKITLFKRNNLNKGQQIISQNQDAEISQKQTTIKRKIIKKSQHKRPPNNKFFLFGHFFRISRTLIWSKYRATATSAFHICRNISRTRNTNLYWHRWKARVNLVNKSRSKNIEKHVMLQQPESHVCEYVIYRNSLYGAHERFPTK